MTVAAVVLAASPASALADADGTPGIRRIADTAWAGGATPVVVCSFDPVGGVAAALANAETTLVEPVDPMHGPVGQIVNGIGAARRLVAETDAALVWPARLTWVDAETVTQLIEIHGQDRDSVVRPAYRGEAGFPVLLPIAHLAAFAALGDPGTTHDVSVARASLPPFDGPPVPVDANEHEWGAAAADIPDEEPPTGPAPAAASLAQH